MSETKTHMEITSFQEYSHKPPAKSNITLIMLLIKVHTVQSTGIPPSFLGRSELQSQFLHVSSSCQPFSKFLEYSLRLATFMKHSQISRPSSNIHFAYNFQLGLYKIFSFSRK